MRTPPGSSASEAFRSAPRARARRSPDLRAPRWSSQSSSVTSTFHVTRASLLFRRCYRGTLDVAALLDLVEACGSEAVDRGSCSSSDVQALLLTSSCPCGAAPPPPPPGFFFWEAAPDAGSGDRRYPETRRGAMRAKPDEHLVDVGYGSSEQGGLTRSRMATASPRARVSCIPRSASGRRLLCSLDEKRDEVRGPARDGRCCVSTGVQPSRRRARMRRDSDRSAVLVRTSSRLSASESARGRSDHSAFRAQAEGGEVVRFWLDGGRRPRALLHRSYFRFVELIQRRHRAASEFVALP